MSVENKSMIVIYSLTSLSLYDECTRGLPRKRLYEEDIYHYISMDLPLTKSKGMDLI